MLALISGLLPANWHVIVGIILAINVLFSGILAALKKAEEVSQSKLLLDADHIVVVILGWLQKIVGWIS